MSGMGHNSRTLNDAARQNVETGVLLLCKEFLVTAIQDSRLQRTHLKVLASIVQFLNRHSAKAWPDRRTIAAALGIEPVTVSNTLRELRLWGYLIAERERVPEANNRSLTVYTFGNVDHETIRREIQIYIDRIKGLAASGVTSGGDFANAQESPQRVTVTSQGDFENAKVTSGGGRESPPRVDSNSLKELTSKVPPNPPRGDGGGDAAFEEFWAAYPNDARKRDKAEARDLFYKIVTGKHRKGRRATAETLIDAVKRGCGIDPDFVPMPTTWLNKGRWLDDPPPEKAEDDPVMRRLKAMS